MSSSVTATSTPRAAKLCRVVRKLLLYGLPLLKCDWKPTQSIGTPRCLKSWTMEYTAWVLAQVQSSML